MQISIKYKRERVTCRRAGNRTDIRGKKYRVEERTEEMTKEERGLREGV
jgi:hypothetical protein